MPAITFRFATECEMTLQGPSYEDIYLRFKDFMHGDLSVAQDGEISVCPPESDQMFFHLEQQETLHEIPFFKGGFKQDIAERCDEDLLTTPSPQPNRMMLSQKVQNLIPSVYW